MSSAPDGYRNITPRIAVAEVEAQVDFLRQAFGATGEMHDGRPVELTIGDSMVMVGPIVEREPFPAFLYIYVEDVDETHRRAVKIGAKTMETPKDTPYGDRRAMIRDPFGNVFQIARRLSASE